MTITDDTRSKYLMKAGAIRRRFTHETGREPEADWEQFHAWMDTLYSTLAPASRRFYHAALTCHQNQHHPDHPLHPIPRGLLNRPAIRAEHGKRGPAQKSKAFPVHVERALIRTLQKAAERSGASIYNTWALAFLRAGVAFGLRPSEWLRARFLAMDNGERVLHVINAKQGNERAFGPTRTLLIRRDILDSEAGDDAECLIGASINMSVDDFQDVLDRTARQLRRVIASCGAPCRPRSGNSITLYTTRHQFAANAKLAGMTLVEIAALMGHASTDTAARHYGRRQHGRSHSRIAVKPHPENVRAVQEIADRKALKKANRQTTSRSFAPG